MRRIIACAVLAILASVVPAWPARAQYSIKTATTPVPKDLQEPVAKLLSDQSIQLLDSKGTLVAEVWLRKEIDANLTAAQVKNGVTYRDLEETTLLGAVRFDQPVSDYRKQKIKPGVYTLRLGFQPMDGDHMGTAPYGEFCLAVPAAKDANPEPMKKPKELYELSNKATGTSHPGVFLLFPNTKPEDAPKIANKGDGTWAINGKEAVTSGSEKAVLGISLALVGYSSAA